MNPKSAIIVVLVVFLATTSCLPSRRSSKDVLFKQFLREMQKGGSLGDLDEVLNVIAPCGIYRSSQIRTKE